ncbi:MAG: Crp/Fnr family transcriptional regulator [Mycobacteriales bacterium]
MRGFIKELPLFAGIDEGAQAALEEHLVAAELRKGDVIFRQGEPGTRLYLVLDGKAKLYHTTPDGRENMLAVVGPGEVIGELSLFDPGERTATAAALTDCRVVSLDHDALRPWLRDHLDVAEALLAAMARRLRRTNEAMADLVFTDVPGRVAKAVLDMANRFGETDARGILVQLDLTQEELAQLVGASRETVNKALSEFATRGWLSQSGRGLLILDPERLANRAR